jgi:hypothetical protein
MLLVSSAASASVINVHVLRTNLGETLDTYIIPIKPMEYNQKAVWRSPNGIDCSVSLLAQAKGGASGGYECITPDGYKAQVSLDCDVNKNRETAMYLFFGKIGDEKEVGNFYVWCE